MTRPGHPFTGTALVLAAAALFSVNGTVSKSVLKAGLSPTQLVEVRCLLAALVFLLVAAARGRPPGRPALRARELGAVAVYGVVGVALVQWLYFVAIARMPVGIALLLEFTAPVMVALWVRFVRGRPVRRRLWVALALVLLGLALVAEIWRAAGPDATGLDGIGVLAGLGAAVSLSAYYLLGERHLDRHDPAGLAAGSFAAAAAFWLLAEPIWRFPTGVLTTPVDLGPLPQLPGWVLLAWVVGPGTVAPFGLVLAGLRRISATRAALVGTAEPPLAGLVAWCVLGENLSAPQLIGGAVVLFGVVLAETSRTDAG